jgi:muramoyltetrapeptide carboxypeptidase
VKKRVTHIGVVATGRPVTPDVAERVQSLVADVWADGRVAISFHPQCFLEQGHFAGSDAARADAFVEVANDPAIDALWIARGGWGAARIAEDVLPRLSDAARAKSYMGYSDAGTLMAALYAGGMGRQFHGPMPVDIVREGGDEAVVRALRWLVEQDRDALEPCVGTAGAPTAAFNLTILSNLMGTPWLPDLSGHVLMLEEVGEYMYRIDRALAQITSNPAVRAAAGIRLGRCSDIPSNDPDFGRDEEDVTREWCARSGIEWLGRADIGHDVANKVVPFGAL